MTLLASAFMCTCTCHLVRPHKTGHGTSPPWRSPRPRTLSAGATARTMTKKLPFFWGFLSASFRLPCCPPDKCACAQTDRALCTPPPQRRNNSLCSCCCCLCCCWVYAWRCCEFLAVIFGVSAFVYYSTRVCERADIHHTSYTSQGTPVVIIVEGCENWKELDILLALLISVGLAGCVALLGLIRHCDRYFFSPSTQSPQWLAIDD